MYAEMFNIIMSWEGQSGRPTKGLHRTAGHQINLEDKTLQCKFSDARVPLVEGWENGKPGLSCSRTRANRKLCQDMCVTATATDPATYSLSGQLPTATAAGNVTQKRGIGKVRVGHSIWF